MDELLTLIKRTYKDGAWVTTSRQVLCGLRSIGMREFYAASATEYRPEVKFVLADYLDYDDETLAIHNGVTYRILRTYRAGLELELTAERAPAEEAST